ncbi:MAG: glycosyltransferase family 39 protein [Candidatus Levybacteria bacterium]|nr:glycosyltransferase family 39 protein [Candidatus Levybacteria bacterium]
MFILTNFKKKLIIIFLILIITLLGGIIRSYKLEQVPAGFFCDEAAIGYNAYKLLTTGKDEYGKIFPFFFRSFGDYRLPIPIYSNIPFIKIFGLNEFSVRLTAAFFGTLTIPVVYFLVLELFRRKTIAFFTSFFLAISPWHIHFSRFGSEYIYFSFWFSLGLLLFLVGLRKNKKIFLLSFLIFGISSYTYYPALFTVPIFIFFIVIIYNREVRQQKIYAVLALLLFLLAFVPFLLGAKNGTILTRWNNVSPFKSNRSENLLQKMSNTYLAHFSYDFLFEKGDIDFPGHFIRRFSVKGVGELYKFQLPLIILGFFSFFYLKKKVKSFFIIIIWFLLYPLGSTLTGTDGGGPFAFRSIFGVIPFQITSALGIFLILKSINLNKKILKYSIFTVFIISFIFISAVSFKDYLSRYFMEYNLYSSDFWGWQYGPREVMSYFLKNKDSYDKMLLMGNFNAPQIFLKFYDPENKCQSKCQIGGTNLYVPSEKQLFAIDTSRISEIPSSLALDIKKTIYYPNNSPAFYIGTLTK